MSVSKQVKLEDLFEIVYDETDPTRFHLEVKPTFNERRVRIFTEYGQLDIHHTFEGEEWIDVNAFPCLHDECHSNKIQLRSFDVNPHNEGGEGLIIITKSVENIKDEERKKLKEAMKGK